MSDLDGESMNIENFEAYRKGYQSSIDADGDPRMFTNPYPENSPEWQSWNQGWNAHFEPSWLKQSWGIFPESEDPILKKVERNGTPKH